LRVALALALAAAPAAAQHKRKPDSRRPTAGQAERGLVGLPVFSSDGKRIGMILATGVDDDNRVVAVAEIERPLGMGADAVAIPFDMFVRKPGRIELTITAAEVNDRISAAGRRR
jgi:hypothetical protein